MIATDADYQLVFPPRTKTDLNIRRDRLADVAYLYKNSVSGQEWRLWLPRLINLDYITVQNLMRAHFIHGDFLSLFWNSYNLFDLDDYLTAAKWVNDRLKKFPAPEDLLLKYAECGTMAGYRNLPFKGIDRRAEAKALVSTIEEHGFVDQDWLKDFSAVCEEITTEKPTPQVEYMSLKEFIASDLWSTQGSSSVGKVEWRVGDEQGKFKARKNFLKDLYTTDQLYQICLDNAGKQVNMTLVKSELGKMRIAVASDIWTYLIMSWLNYLCGHVYTLWEENTLEETPQQQAQRMSDTLDELEDAYGLPFDFRGFDHQPRITETQIMAEKYFRCGRVNVPDAAVLEWTFWVSKTVDSFANAVLIDRDDQAEPKEVTLKVEAGVMSGIRLTSLFGDMWNRIATRIAKRRCFKAVAMAGLMVRLKLSSRSRGDDSQILSNSYWGCLLMRLGYQAINAIGANGKFGIHKHKSEFLRIWYSKGRVWGYPNRAIPGLSQRKPWNSEAWTEEGTVKAQFESLRIIERRLGRRLPKIEESICVSWSRRRKQSQDWLRTPVSLGGLGLMTWRGSYPSKKWIKFEPPQVDGLNIRPDRYVDYQTRFSAFNLTDDEAKALLKKNFSAKIAADDVVGLNHIFRVRYKEELARFRTSWKRIKWYATPTLALTDEERVLRSFTSPVDMSAYANTAPGVFGKWRKLQETWTDAQVVSQVRTNFKAMEYMESLGHQEFVYDCRKLEKRGLHRTMALGILFGKVEGLTINELHPQLYEYLSIAVVRILMSQRFWDDMSLAWLTGVWTIQLASALLSSTLSQKVFLY